MTADVDVGNRLLNRGHMTSHALAAFAGRGMLGMKLDPAAKSRLQDGIVTL